jgi:hypothetical protein
VFSSFFRDLKSLPQNDRSDEVIPLPSATAQGLAYSFAAISTIVNGAPPPPLPTPDQGSSAFDEVIIVADAYDLPILLWALFGTAKATAPPASAFTLYTLAALSKRSDEVKNLSLDLLAMPIAEMDEWSQTTLRKKDPLALIDLHNFYWRFTAALNRFVEATGFSFACQQTESGYTFHGSSVNKPVCFVHRNWENIPNVFAEQHLQAVRGRLRTTPKLILAPEWYIPATGCDTCDKTLLMFISKAKQKYILPVDYTFIM